VLGDWHDPLLNSIWGHHTAVCILLQRLVKKAGQKKSGTFKAKTVPEPFACLYQLHVCDEHMGACTAKLYIIHRDVFSCKPGENIQMDYGFNMLSLVPSACHMGSRRTYDLAVLGFIPGRLKGHTIGVELNVGASCVWDASENLSNMCHIVTGFLTYIPHNSGVAGGIRNKFAVDPQTVSLCISAFANILLATLISVRLIQHQRHLRKTLGKSHGSLYTRVITMCVESSALIVMFCLPSVAAALVVNYPSLSQATMGVLAYVYVCALCYRISIYSNCTNIVGMDRSSPLF
ncbi:hypothetical protein CVT25_009300, partial [Psilocybe cyanescens]